MNGQKKSAKMTSGNTSELEMVGALLFGSIVDENASDQTDAQAKSGNRSRKVNLGSRIAPEMSRQWEASEPEIVLSSQDISTISEIIPERRNPAPVSPVNEMVSENVSENVSALNVEPLIPSSVPPVRKGNLVTQIYGISLTLMTLCVVVLGWQLFVDKNQQSNQASQPLSASTAPVTGTEAPMVPTVEEPTMETAESAFASMPVEDASRLADANPLPEPPAMSALPDVNSSVGTAMNDAPVYQSYGDSVAISEEIPTFNAELASMVPETDPLLPSAEPVSNQISTPVQNTTQPTLVAETTAWNAGETMEEIPVFNSELSSFNQAPQVAPLAPQVGSMAPLPTSLPQNMTSAQSPRKLAPPAVGQMDPNAAVQPSAPVSSESATEEYPSFNPNLGVDGALPVSYY